MPGKQCRAVAAERKDGYTLYDEVIKLGVVKPGRTRSGHLPGFGQDHNWVQRSIFWDLEYWPTLLVRHNLDVMHIEKNFFDNLFYTLLDDPKTKDNVKSRADMEELNFNDRGLFLQTAPGRRTCAKPEAIYTVNKKQKRDIFDWVRNLRFPDGYASNIATCFNDETFKVTGMKSHDCHVFLQRLLPVAFDVLPEKVWKVVTEVSMFFRRLGAPRVLASEMEALQTSIVETICKLEQIFPPSFFDSMEHLPIHLPYEARVCGPVQYRWMYPFERYVLIAVNSPEHIYVLVT